MNEFFANFYELWGFNMTTISDSLYDYDLYATIGYFMVAACLLAFFIYYYWMNNPAYNKTKHWLIAMTAASLVVSIFALIYSKVKFDYEQLGYVFGDYVQFTLTVLLLSMVFFFIVSLLGKHWSSQCKDSPFRTRK